MQLAAQAPRARTWFITFMTDLLRCQFKQGKYLLSPQHAMCAKPRVVLSSISLATFISGFMNGPGVFRPFSLRHCALCVSDSWHLAPQSILQELDTLIAERMVIALRNLKRAKEGLLKSGTEGAGACFGASLNPFSACDSPSPGQICSACRCRALRGRKLSVRVVGIEG